MNTQLQKVIVVLFLMLILTGVTILFWLPVNNETARIVVAKEGDLGLSKNLLDLTEEKASHQQMSDTAATIDREIIIAQDQITSLTDPKYHEQEASELQLTSNESNVTEEVSNAEEEPADAVLNLTTSGIERSVEVPLQEVDEPVASKDYAYDIMGNKRSRIADHTVKPNDWFSKITSRYWDDLFMWPDLYTMNSKNLKSKNPDLIYPGEKISIYESLTADGDFSEQDRLTLLSAYLRVYTSYKQAGERKSLATVQLLVSAMRYDKNFLDNYSHLISTKDKQAAQSLLKEQKFLD